MQIGERERLTESQLHEFLDTLFPNGVAGEDVLAELAPDGWAQSPLVACFHPSVERAFEERLRMHHRIEELRGARRRADTAEASTAITNPEPTLDSVRESYERKAVKPIEELTEIVGQCLWDVFSDNHDVIAADGRVADIGSFRGASAFLDEWLTGRRDTWREGDCMRFYMGTWGIAGRADLTPVYTMIFRRLKALGTDWVYHFPELFAVELGLPDHEDESPKRYSPNEALAAERAAREREAEMAQFRAELADANAQAREAALDQPPPAVVSAYRAVYRCDPSGWPPA